MISANMHQAKTQLSKLIQQAEAGEDVVISRAGKPVVRLVPVEPQPVKPSRREAWEAVRRDWAAKGQRIWLAPEAEMTAFEEELADIMNGDVEEPEPPAE